MGYGYYVLPDGREAGYGVIAECDHPDCTAEIDRGLAYLCGRAPDGHRDPSEPGCGRYHCPDHQYAHDCPNPDGYDEDDEEAELRRLLLDVYLPEGVDIWMTTRHQQFGGRTVAEMFAVGRGADVLAAAERLATGAPA